MFWLVLGDKQLTIDTIILDDCVRDAYGLQHIFTSCTAVYCIPIICIDTLSQDREFTLVINLREAITNIKLEGFKKVKLLVSLKTSTYLKLNRNI